MARCTWCGNESAPGAQRCASCGAGLPQQPQPLQQPLQQPQPGGGYPPTGYGQPGQPPYGQWVQPGQPPPAGPSGSDFSRKLSDAVTALVVGNWRPAAVNALLPLGVMAGLILIVAIVVESAGDGIVPSPEDSNAVGNVLFGAFSYLALAVGGSFKTSRDDGEFGSGFSAQATEVVTITPLLASLAGFGLLLFLYVRRGRRAGSWTPTGAAVEAVRTLVVFLVPVLLVGIFTKRELDDEFTGFSQTQSAATASTFGWALLWALLTLGAGVLVLSPVARRPELASALGAAKLPARFLGMFGIAVVTGTLIYLLVGTATLGDDTFDVEFSDKVAAFVLGLLFLPNLAVNLVSIGMGASLQVSSDFGAAGGSFSLSDLLDASAWNWFVPVLLAVLLVAAAAALAARQPTMPQAQRAVAVFVGLFPAVTLFGAILSSEMPVPLNVALHDTHVGATFGLAILWGLGAALLGLGVAAATPWGTHLRAARPGVPGAPAAAPGWPQPPTGPGGYGWPAPPQPPQPSQPPLPPQYGTGWPAPAPPQAQPPTWWQTPPAPAQPPGDDDNGEQTIVRRNDPPPPPPPA